MIKLEPREDRFGDIYLYDATDYPDKQLFTFALPEQVLHLEKFVIPNFLPNWYRNGLYYIGEKDPVIYFGYVDVGNRTYNITCKEDFLELIKLYGEVKIGNKVFESINIKLYEDYITEVSTFPILTEKFIKYMLNTYITTDNIQYQAVISDPLLITTNISLVEKEYVLDNVSVESFIEATNLYHLSSEIKTTYEHFLTKYLYNWFDYVTESKYTTRVDVKNSYIVLTKLPTPYERRYMLNLNQKGRNDGGLHA